MSDNILGVFSILDFPLLYNQLFFLSATGYDIPIADDGNPTISTVNKEVYFNYTTNAMMFILCL